MTKHLFGIVCTHHGAAANNRGETEGNITTLQKLLWNGEVHTTVSAEAIRWALRYWWQAHEIPTNRRWDPQANGNAWELGGVFDPARFIDDDVLGFMAAEAARAEGDGDGEPDSGRGRRRRARGTATVRRARLEVSRAISLIPWGGDITFNAASINATPSAARRGANPVPYGTEVHATRYQYGFAFTPAELEEPGRALLALDAIAALGEVAGNHARFLYDFSPESIVLRWTDDFAPRMLYAFETSGGAELGAGKLVRAVESGDVHADEVVIGGELARMADGQRLQDLGCHVHTSIRSAVEMACVRMRADLGLANA